MSGIRYKRTRNLQDDESPLPVNASETDDIEMDSMGQSAVDEEENIPSSDPPSKIVFKRRRKEMCYMIWALLSTGLLFILIAIAILAHQPKRSVKWCCISDEEMQKCSEMTHIFDVKGFRPEFSCVRGSSIDDCVAKVDKDEADAFTIPNHYLFKHRKILQPIMAEDYENSDFGYYFVAVVKKSDSDANLTVAGLQSKFACISDVELATGYLYNKTSVFSDKSCQSAKDPLHDLFGSNLCAPEWDEMNRGCSKETDSNKILTKDQLIEKCLFTQNIPVIGFIDHLRLTNYFNMNSSYNREDYQLLCPDGSRGTVKDFKECHLLWEPSRSVVVSNKIRSGQDIDIPLYIVEVLHVAQIYVGSHTVIDFNMFRSEHGKDLLFQDETEKLVPLLSNCSSENYLGVEYMTYRWSYECKAFDETLDNCMIPQYT